MRIRRRQKTVIRHSSGSSSTLSPPLKHYVLSAGSGSYAISGSAALLLARRHLVAGAGSYSVIGADASLIAARLLSAGHGAYTIAGADVTFGATIHLEAASGSYLLTGADADLKVSRRFVAGSGSYSLTGYQAELIYSAAIVAVPPKPAAGGGHRRRAAVQYVINEPPAPQVELRHFRLKAQAGEYSITGAATTFAVTRRPKPAALEVLHEPDLPRKAKATAAVEDVAAARKRRLIALDNEFLLMVA